MSDLVTRLRELSYAAAREDWSKFSRRVPAQPERDADFLLLDAAWEITRLRAENAELRNRLVNLEDEKNTYINYVGDALGQDHDGESLWDAAQRVLSDRDRIRVERDELRAQIAAHENISNFYYELLYQFAEVAPGETRHETAMRILREHEARRRDGPEKDARLPGEE